VFLIATHNALSAPDFYRLPPNQVVELGAQVSI
jgi:K+ transporter